MTLLTASIIIFADIFMMGDSTMCDYKPGSYPQEGWGQRLRTFTKDGVKVHNRAVGGISSKTFIDSGRWQKVLDDIGPGDYAIMAFGHNDATKSKPQRYCNKADYTKNMELFIDGIRGKGATPILATSIIHIGGVSEVVQGTGNGRCYKVRADAAGLGPYLAATRELAAAKGVPLLDLNAAAKAAQGGFYTRDQIHALEVGNLVLDVDAASGTARVGVQLMETSNLSDPNSWRPVGMTTGNLDVGSDGTVGLNVPATGNAKFFKVVVPEK